MDLPQAERTLRQFNYHAEQSQELMGLNMFRAQQYIRAEVWAGNLFSVRFLEYLVQKVEAGFSGAENGPLNGETKQAIEMRLLVLLVHWGGGHMHEELMLLFNLVSVPRVQVILDNASRWIKDLTPAEISNLHSLSS